MKSIVGVGLVVLGLLLGFGVYAEDKMEIERWGMFEVALKGSNEGNPFLDVSLSAEFLHKNAAFEPRGFYDGEGIYKIRFMETEAGVAIPVADPVSSGRCRRVPLGDVDKDLVPARRELGIPAAPVVAGSPPIDVPGPGEAPAVPLPGCAPA